MFLQVLLPLWLLSFSKPAEPAFPSEKCRILKKTMYIFLLSLHASKLLRREREEAEGKGGQQKACLTSTAALQYLICSFEELW